MARAHPARHGRITGIATTAIAVAAVLFALNDAASADVDLTVTITNHGDSIEPGESECPHEELCTLRRAIELVNGDETPDVTRYIIRFDAEVFPPDEPVNITIVSSPLPVIARDDVTVDGGGAGVTVDGSALSGADGIAIEGADARVSSIAVQGFDGTCVHVDGHAARVTGVALSDCTTGLHIEGDNSITTGVDATDAGVGVRVEGGSASIVGNTVASCEHGISVTGEGATVVGNTVDDCETAVRLGGAGGVVEANTIGLAGGSGGAAVGAGIVLETGFARIGHLTDGARANRIGNAQTGIRIGGDGGSASADVLGNVIGIAHGGGSAPGGTGLEIVPPGADVQAAGNLFANVETGVAIVGVEGSAPSIGNTLRENEYANIGVIAIDFGPTGDRVPNGPDSQGPNGLQNHPEFTEATQARVLGMVPGPCPVCTVDLYLAERRGGGQPDVPLELIEGATVTTGLSGVFGFINPPVSPGEWVIAIVTDQDGNTSEFSRAVRIGTGFVQCGNESLYPGWNARGYFGADAPLGTVFPPGSSPPGPIRSIHQRVPAAVHGFFSWFQGTGNVNDLSLLQAAEAYWFWADEHVQLPESLLLTAPPPVTLDAGWNDFVYMGAEDAVEVALAGLDSEFVALFRYVSDGDGGRWLTYGAPDTPSWARGFTTLEPCAVYTILMDEAATFVPLQP